MTERVKAADDHQARQWTQNRLEEMFRAAAILACEGRKAEIEDRARKALDEWLTERLPREVETRAQDAVERTLREFAQKYETALRAAR